MKASKLFFVSLIMLATIASAQVPQMINYDGFLTKPNGEPVNDGVYEITFTIYSGLPPLTTWTSGPQNITVANGLFDYQLGSAVPFPQGIFLSDTLYWLGIQVGSDPEISPRTRLVATPFAFQALRADTADFAEADNSGWIDEGTVVRLETAADSVGIGTTTPDEKLTVDGNLHVAGNVIVDGIISSAEGCRIITGTYSGDGSGSREIYLGVRPKFVLLACNSGAANVWGAIFEGYAIEDRGESNENHNVTGYAQPFENGFTVGTGDGFNCPGNTYYYVALY